MKLKPLLLLLCIVTLFSACKKESFESKKDFEKSYAQWLNFKTASGNSYQYTVGGGSWTGIGWQTDITVSKGKVVQRHFKLTFPDGWTGSMPDVDKMEWTENENEIGLHENAGAAPATLDEVYEKARNNWLKKRENATTYFEAKNNGLISSCGYVQVGCVDDCFIGITITSIELL